MRTVAINFSDSFLAADTIKSIGGQIKLDPINGVTILSISAVTVLSGSTNQSVKVQNSVLPQPAGLGYMPPSLTVVTGIPDAILNVDSNPQPVSLFIPAGSELSLNSGAFGAPTFGANGTLSTTFYISFE